MTYKLTKSDRTGVVRIVAIYAVFSSLWIYLSDSLLGLLVRDAATMTRLSLFKGIAFIVLTALLLYRLIIRHALAARQADERIVELNKALEKRNTELARLLNRKKLLFDASVKITSQTNLNDLLTAIAETARELAGARYSAAGHGYVNGKFITGGASRSEGATPCPPGQVFNVERGGVYMDLVEKSESLCLTDAEMRAHPMWWGLPDDHVPMRGLLGSRLIDFRGQPNGMILVSDKEDGSDFTAEDEAALRQLAIIASLALQHIESEESLQQAKEAADAANRVKSQFLANMSHELRAPMAGVLGMLEIALGGPLEGERREFIQTAHHSAGALVRILNDILEMTRIESGMLPIEKIPFSLRECVTGVVEIFTAEARRKGLDLVLSVADDVPKNVLGDQLRLR
ncbi:MAG: histidine kinase dimerization/phospho-acceptor domain-containing protein, partial [Candidatus Krumholzibacteriia bacterium]